tara:strand:- start:30 stop:143 length:114 start_codon:yes stop_codon:yes gene_type:complete
MLDQLEDLVVVEVTNTLDLQVILLLLVRLKETQVRLE